MPARKRRASINDKETVTFPPLDEAPAPGERFTPREQQIHDDYEWCLHSAAVQRKYKGKIVLAYKRRIWGAGKTRAEAERAALRRPGCPLPGYMAKVYIAGVPVPPAPEE